MRERAVRKRLWGLYRRAVGDTPLRQPFDALELVERLSVRRGRRIEVIPVDARPDLPCGLLVVTGDADCILYSTGTTELHQRHILIHEAAHLVCGHDQAPDPAAGTRQLLPHLPDALVRQVLGRTVYSEPQEREAELLASLICARAEREARSPLLTGGQQQRLGSVFGARRARSARTGGARD
ncbi:ParH-like protein [Actinacidiphila yeochonensis]|uniref:ParH-like protein n=1 Tax=Actinacidiphila yeochonensis TaxID=89050 RepID=UPI0012FE8928|nr:ParH-like protein [Actinacidiphila yeochonensis]